MANSVRVTLRAEQYFLRLHRDLRIKGNVNTVCGINLQNNPYMNYYNIPRKRFFRNNLNFKNSFNTSCQKITSSVDFSFFCLRGYVKTYNNESYTNNRIPVDHFQKSAIKPGTGKCALLGIVSAFQLTKRLSNVLFLERVKRQSEMSDAIFQTISQIELGQQYSRISPVVNFQELDCIPRIFQKNSIHSISSSHKKKHLFLCNRTFSELEHPKRYYYFRTDKKQYSSNSFEELKIHTNDTANKASDGHPIETINPHAKPLNEKEDLTAFMVIEPTSTPPAENLSNKDNFPEHVSIPEFPPNATATFLETKPSASLEILNETFDSNPSSDINREKDPSKFELSSSSENSNKHTTVQDDFKSIRPSLSQATRKALASIPRGAFAMMQQQYFLTRHLALRYRAWKSRQLRANDMNLITNKNDVTSNLQSSDSLLPHGKGRRSSRRKKQASLQKGSTTLKIIDSNFGNIESVASASEATSGNVIARTQTVTVSTQDSSIHPTQFERIPFSTSVGPDKFILPFETHKEIIPDAISPRTIKYTLGVNDITNSQLKEAIQMDTDSSKIVVGKEINLINSFNTPISDTASIPLSNVQSQDSDSFIESERVATENEKKKKNDTFTFSGDGQSDNIQDSSELMRHYEAVLQMVLKSGSIEHTEKRFLAEYRRRCSIGVEQHIEALGRFGWTLPEFEEGTLSALSNRTPRWKKLFNKFTDICEEKGNYIVTIGSLASLTSIMMASMLHLRSLQLVAGILHFVYNITRRPALTSAAYWNLVFFAINGIMLLRLFLENIPETFTDAELDVFERHFLNTGLSPRQFKKLLTAATWKTVPEGTELVRQGEEVSELIILYKGKLVVNLNGSEVETLEGGDKNAIIGLKTFLSNLYDDSPQPSNNKIISTQSVFNSDTDIIESDMSNSSVSSPIPIESIDNRSKIRIISNNINQLFNLEQCSVSQDNIKKEDSSSLLKTIQFNTFNKSLQLFPVMFSTIISDLKVIPFDNDLINKTKTTTQQQNETNNVLTPTEPEPEPVSSINSIEYITCQQNKKMTYSSNYDDHVLQSHSLTSTTSVIAASESLLLIWPMKELVTRAKADPVNIGFPIVGGMAKSLVARARNQSLKQSFTSYQTVLQAILSDGEARPEEKLFLEECRQKFGVSDKQHLELLERLGWSENEFNNGAKRGVILQPANRAIRAILSAVKDQLGRNTICDENQKTSS